jgi:hypothetical protein
MVQQRKWMAAAIAMVLGLVFSAATPSHAQFPFPQAPQPQQPAPQPFGFPPQQPTDPRIAQIRAGLEQYGLRVHKVGFLPASGNELPRWYAETAANYPRPDFGPVAQQALTIWAVMFNVVGQDPPQTVLIGDQVWSKYSLLFAVQLGSVRTFADSFRAAGNDQGRQQQALQALFQAARFRVYDNERRQFVDEKDFVNKNFTGR